MALKAKTTRRKRPEKTEAIEEVTKVITKRLNAEIPQDLHKKIKSHAVNSDQSITDIVINALIEYLSNHSDE